MEINIKIDNKTLDRILDVMIDRDTFDKIMVDFSKGIFEIKQRYYYHRNSRTRMRGLLF